MSYSSLEEFWGANKEAIGSALSRDTAALAQALRGGAEAFSLTQEIQAGDVRWLTKDGELALVFSIIPDPRDLERVLEAFARAQAQRSRLTALFVHQWTDGEGNWDVFLINSQSCLHHADRITGSCEIQEREPVLRNDIYTLFATERDFPAPGQARWAQLLGGAREELVAALGALAVARSCTQTVRDTAVQWRNRQRQLEAQFVILPDTRDLDAVIRIYQDIRTSRCPVSFIFAKSDRAGVYDIFRFSSRSYLEHHNQVRAAVSERTSVKGVVGRPVKELANLRWVPRWASHVGCIKGCLNYLDIQVSDAWLFGATGHAFVLNISPGLCPSGPTDWSIERFLQLGRNIGYVVERVDEYCPHQDADLRAAQEQAWAHVRGAIDAGAPCYGWELDIPEYSVIHGYDEVGYYISGPDSKAGKGPIPRQDLGRSEIGAVVVASVRTAAPADDRRTVCDALRSALEMAHNRRKWTDRAGGLRGYDTWIRALQSGRADRFGLGYNAAVWAESREFAVEFLQECGTRLAASIAPLFEEATGHYRVVASSLKAVADAYPFQECPDEGVPVDQRCRTAIHTLEQAREAEVAGLAVLARILEMHDEDPSH